MYTKCLRFCCTEEDYVTNLLIVLGLGAFFFCWILHVNVLLGQLLKMRALEGQLFVFGFTEYAFIFLVIFCGTASGFQLLMFTLMFCSCMYHFMNPVMWNSPSCL